MKKITLFFLTLFLIYGCSSTKHFLVYEPYSDQNIFYFFQNGIPIGSLTSQEQLILFSVDEVRMFRMPYLRVWLLYENKSTSPNLIEPFKMVTVAAEDKKGNKVNNYLAESPTKILNEIDEQAAVTKILQTIGGALEVMSTQATKIKSNTGNEFIVNDANEKRIAIMKQNKADIDDTALWYETFKQSINSGVLRKNTVFPGQSVNGYIYFPLSDINGSDNSNWGNYNSPNVKIQELTFSLLIETTFGKKAIKLNPIKVW